MRTLITGAGGFIGGRVAEVFHETGFATVRAGVRRWSTAARLGRLPVEIIQCDVTNPDQVRKALEGMNVVVHCASGAGPVTIQGTRNLLQASLDAGIRRFVHISTIEVYGDAVGELDETAPPRWTGSEYGDSKIEAEEECWRYGQRGLAVSVLRPTIVYGPFSPNWTEEFAVRLQVRPWPFPASVCSGTCNLLYVDDLVAAIRLAITQASAVGQAFNVNGSERPTWYQYFCALNEAMGLPPIAAQTRTASTISAWAIKPVRALAVFGLQHFGDQITSLYKRSEWARRIMKEAEARIRKTPTTREFGLYSKHVSYATDKARTMLGHVPAVDMARGIRLSVAWLRHSDFVDSDNVSAS